MLGIRVEKYYASEVDKDAINVSRLNHGDAIEQVGAVESLDSEKLSALGPIDLLLGGSPCADLSLVNPARKGLNGKYTMLW
jgi:DNA (cytosine-5)-methyltransferase 3A